MRTFGLLGETLSYSFSPDIHETIFDTIGIKGDYKLVEVPQAEFGKETFNALIEDFDGMNVTIPYKTKVMPFLDEIHPAAKAIGAVNTIVKVEGKLVGYNTDYFGALESIKSLPYKKAKGAIVLGTGGSSKAVLQCLLALEMTPIYVVSRKPNNNYDNENIQCISYEMLEELAPKDCLLVNCTPVGMKTHHATLNVSETLIKQQSCVFDLVYNPRITPLLEIAEQYKIPNLNGLNMLIIQAIEAEKLWLQNITMCPQTIISKLVLKVTQ
jgi:shikimate dehydrogenase